MLKSIMKNIKIIAIFFVIFMLIFSLIVSHDHNHLDTCHEDHCFVCFIIHFAQNIVNMIVSFTLIAMIGVFIYFYLSRLRKENSFFVLVSLVFQNVQLNE